MAQRHVSATRISSTTPISPTWRAETRQCDQDLKDFSSRLTLAFANMWIMVSVLAGHGPGLGVPVVLE